jgi:hypothetical protein
MLWVVDSAMPKAGLDYPGTWQSFETWFSDEAACREFLERVRWGNTFCCPVCECHDAWRTARRLWMCRSCSRQTSVTAGTIFHRSRLPLRTWFAAMWFVCAQKNGVSALGLQRVLGLGSYETAWVVLHKLRRAMVRPDRELLGGDGVAVEVDQTYVGGRTQSERRPRYVNKTEVVIGVERRHPRGLGRIRLQRIDMSQRRDEVLEFIRTNIAHGTILYTDGELAYAEAAGVLRMRHEPINVSRSDSPAHQLLPAVHRVASLLKRWLAGTHHAGQTDTQLAYYLDEFTFRFNRRASRSRGLLWYRLVQQALDTDPHPYDDLIDKM